MSAKHLFLLFLMLSSCILFAQQPFVKISDINYNRKAHVCPGAQGWVVLTGDSIHLTKFNSCGSIEWTKKYNMPAVEYGKYDFTALSNGDYALIYRHKKNNVSITGVIRFDQNGNIIWSNSYGNNSYNHYPAKILEDNQGNIYLYGMMIDVPVTNAYSYLIKLDGNGNMLWVKLYDTSGNENAIVTSDQGVLMKTMDRLIKTDSSGSILWGVVVLSHSLNEIAPFEVSDGFIVMDRNWNNYQIAFRKIDKQGNLLWPGAKNLSINSDPPDLYKTPSGNFACVIRRVSAGNLYVTIIEFDKDLHIIAENTLATTDLVANSLCFLNDSTPIICGKNFSNDLFVARFEKDYSSSCSIQFTDSIINYNNGTLGLITNVGVTTPNFNLYPESITFDTITSHMSVLCPAPKLLDLGNDTSFCDGSISIHNLTADTFDIYSWSTGETTAAITVAESGTYTLTVKDLCGELSLTDSVIVTRLSSINADAGPDAVLCENESMILQVQPCTNCSYEWNSGSISDTAVIEEPGEYIITIHNPDGCIGSDTIEVQEFKCDCNIYIPGAFTPNNDAKNELFAPSFYCDLTEYKLVIFNRWGQKVFSTDNPLTSWNGKYNGNEVPQGVYMYLLQYSAMVRGERTNPLKKSGTVTLIR